METMLVFYEMKRLQNNAAEGVQEYKRDVTELWIKE